MVTLSASVGDRCKYLIGTDGAYAIDVKEKLCTQCTKSTQIDIILLMAKILIVLIQLIELTVKP
jgi:hypothetical protein